MNTKECIPFTSTFSNNFTIFHRIEMSSGKAYNTKYDFVVKTLRQKHWTYKQYPPISLSHTQDEKQKYHVCNKMM